MNHVVKEKKGGLSTAAHPGYQPYEMDKSLDMLNYTGVEAGEEEKDPWKWTGREGLKFALPKELYNEMNVAKTKRVKRCTTQMDVMINELKADCKNPPLQSNRLLI